MRKIKSYRRPISPHVILTGLLFLFDILIRGKGEVERPTCIFHGNGTLLLVSLLLKLWSLTLFVCVLPLVSF